MTRHRRSLMAALGLLTPACARDVVAVDPAEDARPAEDSQVAGGTGGALADARASRPDRGTGGRPADASPADASRPDGATGGHGGTPVEPRCRAPQPILQLAGAPPEGTGFVQCEDGAVNRPAAVSCTDPLPPGRACELSGSGCAVDADCVAQAHGRCVFGQYEEASCDCAYGCSTDADCGPELACVCGGAAEPWFPAGATCVSAECRTDDDCDGFGCGLSAQNDGCAYDYRLTCRTAEDTCGSNRACGDPDGYTACVRWDLESWACRPGPVCGRPFRIEGVAVVAPFAERADWLGGGGSANPRALSATDRACVTEHYRTLAALEHASVASFARFALELMAFAAPPALLADTAQAMADEVDHARRCFALAAAYGSGPALGPGALPVAGVAPANTLTALAVSVIREACVGELLGATEADFVAENASEPAVVEAFEVIAADERRHAELGWRALQWILRQPGAPSETEVSAAFDAAISAFAEADGAADDRLLGHGLPSAESRRRLFAAAAEQIVRPCVQALLGHDVPGDDAPRPDRSPLRRTAA